ncbi:MAG: peptidoglycan glycosyltransferase [Lachnospiraceae bacterium]|nr:peptidoglycan glycosyltransferase [Lachnospiraceae bacterium]
MHRYKTFNRKKSMIVFLAILFVMLFLVGRLVYLMVFCSEYYGTKAEDLHERERDIKAARGKIIDATGTVLAANKTVCTISVIHNQIEDPEAVIAALVKELGISEEKVRARVEKVSSIERIKANVDKETGERIRAYGLSGIKVDEDYKRYYPFDSLASKVLGFTGGDNQGIIGLEVKYDEYLQGKNGKILTLTDARGVEIENAGETRLDPIDGNNLHISLDYNIQMYAQQAASKALKQKQADSVSVIVMNPKNGEMMAMVNVPEFNLNEPFTLNYEVPETVTEEEKQNLLNQMWRNQCINDTYEPGSTFKIITTAAALEEGVVSLEDSFFCPGYITVEDRRIRCHKRTGHGAEDFVHGIMNSCNPVFIDVGLRIGAENFYEYFSSFGLLKKTGIDLPGEAATIMHAKENIGLVELATMSFGQSFQITPVQLVSTVSAFINGGNRVTPHFGVAVKDNEGNTVETFSYETGNAIVGTETSEKIRYLLEKVVSEGGGSKAKIAGYSIGGKTATSQTLPRSANKYISSFLGFAPADDPKVLVLVVINNPQGIYYGGTIAAPVAKEIFEDILPYLGVEYDEEAAREAETELAEY